MEIAIRYNWNWLDMMRSLIDQAQKRRRWLRLTFAYQLVALGSVSHDELFHWNIESAHKSDNYQPILPYIVDEVDSYQAT